MYEDKVMISFNYVSDMIFKELEDYINEFLIGIKYHDRRNASVEEIYSYWSTSIHYDYTKFDIILDGISTVRNFIKKFWKFYENIAYKYNTTEMLNEDYKYDIFCLSLDKTTKLNKVYMICNCFLENIHYDEYGNIVLRFDCKGIYTNYRILCEKQDFQGTLYTIEDKSRIGKLYEIYINSFQSTTLINKEKNKANDQKMLYIVTDKTGTKVEKVYECYMNPNINKNKRKYLLQNEKKEFVLKWHNHNNNEFDEVNNKPIIKFDKKLIEE